MADDAAIQDLHRKIRREREIINAAQNMRQASSNAAVASSIDSQVRESRRNIQYFEQTLQDLQQRKLNDGMRNVSLDPAAPPPPAHQPGSRNSNSPLPPLPGANAVAGLNTLYGNSNGYGNNLYGLPPSPRQSRTPSPEKQSRVISRSGADIADESVLYLHPEENRSAFSMRSRRDVSGKVAEEGRGGGIWNRRD